MMFVCVCVYRFEEYQIYNFNESHIYKYILIINHNTYFIWIWLSAINQQHQTPNNFYYQFFHSLAVCTVFHRCSFVATKIYMLFCTFLYVLNIEMIYQLILSLALLTHIFHHGALGIGQWASICMTSFHFIWNFVSNLFYHFFFFIHYKTCVHFSLSRFRWISTSWIFGLDLKIKYLLCVKYSFDNFNSVKWMNETISFSTTRNKLIRVSNIMLNLYARCVYSV